ncbi:hypothetical protein [Nocardioides sp. B-3]|uniref:hypothetical protein n=1 Tax=Nocardioides sp. B-3 TaxID=2895565 RepID=UPI002152AE91|nr:hypothetical protein [Nocardioides sp. B-3]UUZ58819.1 hypothetical protein LP418_22455 [Nocardioides sp. B-3]
MAPCHALSWHGALAQLVLQLVRSLDEGIGRRHGLQPPATPDQADARVVGAELRTRIGDHLLGGPSGVGRLMQALDQAGEIARQCAVVHQHSSHVQDQLTPPR